MQLLPKIVTRLEDSDPIPRALGVDQRSEPMKADIETPRTTRDSRNELPGTIPVDALHRSRSRYRSGFWLAAAAFLTAMAFSTIPTPLYVLYQQRDDFSSFIVTVVFAIYAVGVIISLLLAGHVSDWVGRRSILVPALAIEVLAAVLFVVWPALAGLLVARFVSGLGIGMITATATAQLRVSEFPQPS